MNKTPESVHKRFSTLPQEQEKIPSGLELLDAVRDAGIAFFGTFLSAAPFADLGMINASNFSCDTACATNSSAKQDKAHPDRTLQRQYVKIN
jgi:hypothetical protein